MSEVKERPILFSGDMVRALLAGTKTQTRRICKLQMWEQHGYWHLSHKNEITGVYHSQQSCTQALVAHFCPYGKPGDRLRVKESAWMWCERRPNGQTKTVRQKWHYVPLESAPVHYAMDSQKPSISVVSPETGNQWVWRWKVGRFLPRWASRITLEITEVRVQRLQEISDEDAVAEGIQRCGSVFWRDYLVPVNSSFLRVVVSTRASYSSLWESINGLGSWGANPWVWAVSFKVVQP